MLKAFPLAGKRKYSDCTDAVPPAHFLNAPTRGARDWSKTWPPCKGCARRRVSERNREAALSAEMAGMAKP